ncbi:MAG: TolC family protein, partial [Bacteroidota bacterium]
KNLVLKIIFLLLIFVNQGYHNALSQEKTLNLSLEDVLKLAKDQSLDALIAKNSFRSSYWAHRSYKAMFLPSLNMDATIPDLNRSISQITMPDGTIDFVDQQNVSNYLNLNVHQNITFTGGQLFLRSNLQRLDVLKDSVVTSFLTNPINIGLLQPIFSYNSFKWQRKIEPLKYKEAKKEYINAQETINMKAVNRFFDLVLAQINLSIAEINYSNNDTLYNIAKGRYNLGKIAQNDLYQLELNLLNSKSALNQAKLDLQTREFRLRSYLGISEKSSIHLIVPEEIPELKIDIPKALGEAKKNNPEIVRMTRQIIEADSDVARAKAENRFNANIIANYGLTQSANTIPDAYKDPRNSQQFSFGIQIPIIDWGEGKGKYKMAQSNMEVVKTRVAQQTIDFEQNVFLEVMQFNMQDEQVMIQAKADTVAQNSYDVSKNRFFIGKISVTDLNITIKEKDNAKRNYISALRKYWSYYYNIRQLTLYDFQNNLELTENFDQLIDQKVYSEP